MGLRAAIIGTFAANVVVAGALLATVVWPEPDPVAARVASVSTGVAIPALARTDVSEPRDLEPYRGLGVWTDAFDFDERYVGGPPTVTPADVPAMAAAATETLYIQAARLDDTSSEPLIDAWLLADFLLSAHAHEVDVVGWYLPKWTDGDLGHLQAIADFSVLGQRFDGLGVDIEWTKDVTPEVRNASVVSLTEAIRASAPDLPLAAIVFPPVITDIINQDLWPDFPWQQLVDHYAVWMPMTYWSFRSEASGWRSAYRYTSESVRLLRENLGRPDAIVHPIGGIGAVDGVDDPTDPEEPMATVADLDGFASAVADTGSVGASLYDWNATEPAGRQRMTELFGASSPP